MKLTSRTDAVVDMPKLESPFVREMTGDAYVCTPKINEDYRWVFSGESEAIEKLDGTNTSVTVKNGEITAIHNRKNPVQWFKKGNKRFAEGILEAIDKEYFDAGQAGDGQYFGELVGPVINGNPYGLERHLWLPFSVLEEKCRLKFWDDFVKELEGKSDEEVFGAVSKMFEGLWSIYKRRMGVKGEVDKGVAFEGMAAEGIVFYRRGTNGMCKLRRDMFPFWHEQPNNRPHKSNGIQHANLV